MPSQGSSFIGLLPYFLHHHITSHVHPSPQLSLCFRRNYDVDQTYDTPEIEVGPGLTK